MNSETDITIMVTVKGGSPEAVLQSVKTALRYGMKHEAERLGVEEVICKLVTVPKILAGTSAVKHIGNFQFEADASDIGLAPGMPPQRIMTDIGNGQDFILVEAVDERFSYKQELGIAKLTVWND